MDFIAFSWNSVNVYWYGIVMAVAVILGLRLAGLMYGYIKKTSIS